MKLQWNNCVIALGVLAMTAMLAAPAPAQMSEALAAQLSVNANQKVIVIMKSQHAPEVRGSGAASQRSEAIASEQAPLMDELRQVHASNVKSYRLVNALAATVSQGEVDRLKLNPAVAQVIPDETIRHTKRAAPDLRAVGSPVAKLGKANVAPTTPFNVIPGACADTGYLLEPEGLQLTNTASLDPSALTARSLGIDGTGVKVAWIADGIDVNNPEFIRADGTHVFIDYQDFSGDGPGEPTSGDEAFLDASTIAAQGRNVYNVNGFTAQSYPAACNIVIQGVAPGASLIGLDVFGTFEDSNTSNFLEAIEYAVQTDHVDVINESFGSNLYPETAQDAIKLFDEAAVAAGTVVAVSSGDAGFSNSIGSPATDPLLIGVGASTQFRFYAQTNYDAARTFATTGWLSNNISTISSGGFDRAGATINLVAPGDLSWAACDASSEFSGCFNYVGQRSNIESAGGTSESSPFVAGAAALVIQAYEVTHGGAKPTPALVKQILLSTASDLATNASEQGAGLLNSYRAVLQAESIQTGDGSPAPVGNSLLLSANQLNFVGAPNAAKGWPIVVTNTGAQTQVVTLSGRTLGPDQNVQTGSVTLTDGSSPQIQIWSGIMENYATFSFSVPGGVARLAVSSAYPNGGGATVHFILIDPQGNYAGNSLPQGVSNYSLIDVISPAAGTWTGVAFSALHSNGGVNGIIPWQAVTEQFVSFGTVSHNGVKLAPGQSHTFRFNATTPASPGDVAGSIVVASSLGGTNLSIPVTLRTLVLPGTPFTGALTGGNGRGSVGQTQYYEFKVPSGVKNITANLTLTNDPSNNVGLYLVSPDGDVLGYGQNTLGGNYGLAATAYTLNPAQGLWTLIVDFAKPGVGNEISQTYTGSILFNNVSATATGLPTFMGKKLVAGTPITIPVTITNNGAQAESVFFDARLATIQNLTLASQSSNTVALPLTSSPPFWIVPTQTSSVSVSQTASLPAMFDFQPYAGDPDISSAPFQSPLCSTSQTASYAPVGGAVPQGYWQSSPTECGPYPSPAPAGTATDSMSANTKAFDSAITSPTGDFWLFALDSPSYPDFEPQEIDPGQTTTIYLTLTPSGSSGTVVKGMLYLNNYIDDVPPYGQTTGNELAAFPYAYTIK